VKRQQLKLFPKSWISSHFAFGASLLKGSNPKKSRPFRAKLPLHVVMKSSKAVGERSLLRFNQDVERILDIQAKRHHVQIHGAANAGNHLHLVIQAVSPEYLAAFLKSIAGRIAQMIEGKAKEQSREAFHSKFWDSRPYSRIVSWGREFKNVCRYIGINSTEIALGLPRDFTRDMFAQIQHAVRSGWILKSPTLIAAGFG